MVSSGAVVESSREMPRVESADRLETQINAEKAELSKAWPGLIDLLEDWSEERRAELKGHEAELTELAAIKTQLSNPETRFENLVSEINSWIIDEQTPDLVVDREKAALASLLAYPGIAESGDEKAKLEARYNVQKENLGNPKAKEYVFGDILRQKRAEQKARKAAVAALSNESATLQEVQTIKENLLAESVPETAEVFAQKEVEAPADLPVATVEVEVEPDEEMPEPVAVAPTPKPKTRVRRAKLVKKAPKNLEEQIAAINTEAEVAKVEVEVIPDEEMAPPAPVIETPKIETPQPVASAPKSTPSTTGSRSPSFSSVTPRKGLFERISGWWNDLFKV